MNFLDLRKGLKEFYNKNIFIFFLVMAPLIITGCGLPLYEVLTPPVSFYTSGDSLVGFTTPDDSMIDGYVIFYKIYNDQETLASQEEKMFNSDYYLSSTNLQMPSGDELPLKLHFYRLGFTGKNNVIYPQIPWSGSRDIIQIDFSDSKDQRVGTDPAILINGIDYSDFFGIPARYVKYNSNDIPTIWNGTFKRFVKNYRYDEDSDIKDASKRNNGTVSLNIEIAFVAVSYGISVDNLQPLMSIPVYLGRIQQLNMGNASGIPSYLPE